LPAGRGEGVMIGNYTGMRLGRRGAMNAIAVKAGERRVVADHDYRMRGAAGANIVRITAVCVSVCPSLGVAIDRIKLGDDDPRSGVGDGHGGGRIATHSGFV